MSVRYQPLESREGINDSFICDACGELTERARIFECRRCYRFICDSCRKSHADECTAKQDCLDS